MSIGRRGSERGTGVLGRDTSRCFQRGREGDSIGKKKKRERENKAMREKKSQKGYEIVKYNKYEYIHMTKAALNTLWQRVKGNQFLLNASGF